MSKEDYINELRTQADHAETVEQWEEIMEQIKELTE